MDPTAIFAIFIIFGSGTLILRPIAKALAGRIAGRVAVPAGDTERMRQLESELHDATLRLCAAETELSRTTEKVEFMEKLMSGPAAAPALPHRATVGAGR
ncbi:MAG: hypothetical protein JWM27_683 [Gemmatimonadetes bacterium]|nr:hypothetical protein [Gemmatimonadota bacterium]